MGPASAAAASSQLQHRDHELVLVNGQERDHVRCLTAGMLEEHALHLSGATLMPPS